MVNVRNLLFHLARRIHWRAGLGRGKGGCPAVQYCQSSVNESVVGFIGLSFHQLGIELLQQICDGRIMGKGLDFRSGLFRKGLGSMAGEPSQLVAGHIVVIFNSEGKIPVLV